MKNKELMKKRKELLDSNIAMARKKLDDYNIKKRRRRKTTSL